MDGSGKIMKGFLCLVGIISVSAYPNYRDNIPNGYAVHNPCGSFFWEPVGHFDPSHHTKDKNQFGKVRFFFFVLRPDRDILLL